MKNFLKLNYLIMALFALAAGSAWLARPGDIKLRNYFRTQRNLALPNAIDKRGTIFSADGTPLTALEERQSAWIDLIKARNYADTHPANWKAFCDAIADALNVEDKARIVAAIEKGKSFFYLKRKIDLKEQQKLKALLAKPQWCKVADSVNFVREPMRVYPHQGYFEPVLGFVGLDPNGLEGVEYSYDGILQSQPYLEKSLLKNANTRFRPGTDIYLTMDMKSQVITQNLLLKHFENMQHVRSMEAIVLRAGDSKVMAMASFPNYDPNRYKDTSLDNIRNHAIADSFQLGPMLQPFLLATGIEEYEGFLDPALREAILSRRKDAGLSIGEQIGLKDIYKGISLFRLDQRTGIDFGGEVGSKVIKVPELADSIILPDLASGYGITTSLIRYAYSFNGLITGELREPKLVEKYRLPDGKTQMMPTAETVTTVSPETSATVREFLTQTVKQSGVVRQLDIGGYWNSFRTREQHQFTVKQVHGGAFFTPVNKPEFVVVLKIVFSFDAPEADRNLALLIGQDLITALQKKEQIQSKRNS